MPAPLASSRRRRAVSRCMAVSAAFDVSFGVAMLAFPEPAACWLGIPLPADRTFLGLAGILLLILGGIYVLPVRDPDRYAPVVAVSAAGRSLGAVYLIAVFRGDGHTAFLLAGLADLGLAVAQAVSLWAVGSTESS